MLRVCPVQSLDSFPGLNNGFVPLQTPDITASLVLLKRLFLDVSIQGSFADNSIQMGYRGGPGEVVQSVILGTQGITLEPSPLLSIPVQPAGSLGAMASLASGAAVNDLLLRWDATTPNTKTFIGSNELIEQTVELGTYTRGTYFFLPDTALDAGTLQVWLEDPAGTVALPDGSRFRLAGFNDVTLDSTLGRVTLRAKAKGRVLVHYTKGGVEVGAVSIGRGGLPNVPGPTSLIRSPSATPANFDWTVTYLNQSMSARQVVMPGTGNTLLLWQPGDNSPFEIDNSYAFTTTPPADVSKITYTFMPKNASAVTPTGLQIVSIPSEQRFTISPQAPANRFASWYPFADADGLLYGPQRDSLAGALDVNLLVQYLTPVTAMTLDTNIVPGSVQVKINGVSETRFQVDPTSGTLTLLVPVLPTDRIDVSYETTVQGSTGGDIVLAWRDEIPLSESVTLSLSAGIRWNANPWTYSQVPYAKSGTLIAAAGLSGTGDNLAWSVQAGVAYTDPDTTGILRLFGMEGNSVPLLLTDDNAYPASKPVSSALTQLNRGKLYYRDYRLYGALGAVTLQPLAVVPPPALIPYANGGRMGPYNVLPDAQSIGTQNLAFEFDLGAGQWVGAQMPISAGSDVDLSTARSVTVRLKGVSITGSISVSLEFGSISEDLDGSGVLKAETATTQAGFPIYDASNGVTLLVGAGPRLLGNGILDTEDRNGNGILDREESTSVVAKGPSADSRLAFAADTPWTSVTIPLTDQDRAALVGARGVRIVISEATNSAPATGIVVMDTLEFDSAPFWPVVTVPDTRSDVTVRETTEALALSSQPVGGDFATSAVTSTTYKLFHPNGETNQALEVAWAGLANPFTVQGFVAQGTGGIVYDTIVSYVRSPTAGANYTFSLVDTTGKGASWNVVTSDNAWHEVRVSRTKNTVTVDGAPAGAPSRFDASYGSLSQLVVGVQGTSSGLLYVDEVYCTDPEGSVGAAFIGSLAWKVPGVILAVGGVPLLAGLSVTQDVSLLSAGFAPLYGVPTATEDLSSRTEIGGNVLFTQSAIDVVLRETGGVLTESGGHRVTFPASGSPVTLTDAFALTSVGGFSREDTVHLALGSFADVTADASADAQPDLGSTTGTLTQSWHGTAALSAFSPLTLTSDLLLSQAVDSYELPAEWYGARWLREAALLAPWEQGGDIQRTESLDVKLGMPAAPLGFTLETSAGTLANGYSASGFTQQNNAAIGLDLRAKIGKGDASDMTLDLGYQRALSLTTVPAAGPRFTAETDELVRVLGMQGYLLTLVPLAEVFADNSGVVLPAWAGSVQGSYTPTLTLSAQRPYGSHLMDLLVPSSVQLTVQQQLQQTADLSQTVYHVAPQVTTKAVNLFGALGAYPLLPGVRTDEYSLSLGAALDGTPGELPALTTLSAAGYATFTGMSDNALSVVESLHEQQTTVTMVSNDLQVLYDWKSRPPNGIRLPLLPAEAAGSGTLQHHESVDLTIGWQDQGSYHPFTLVLGHATSLVFEKHVSIKGAVSLGVDAENVGDGALAWRVAGQISLEGKLTF